MNEEIFAVLDAAAERYLEPFFAPTLQFAIRGFQEACGKEGHQFNRHSEDFTLFHIGTWDAALGVIAPLDARKVAMAASFVNNLHRDGTPLTAGEVAHGMTGE